MQVRIYNLMRSNKIASYHRWKFKWHGYDRNATGYGYSYNLGIVLITTWFYIKDK